MNRTEISSILRMYNIDSFETYHEIDTSNGNDFRLNIIIDKKYVLRINNPVMDEARLQSISRLCDRYRKSGILSPALYQNKNGRYLTPYQGHICYLSNYLDFETADTLSSEADQLVVLDEVLKSIGKFASAYSDYDLSPIRSMWSLFDLAPLDNDVDEKQENLDMLVEHLTAIKEDSLAEKLIAFNERIRNRIKAIHSQLPQCVIQGDLNFSNLLVADGHFKGLIDFNMAGTEVNVNHFCCETNSCINEDDFSSKDALAIYNNWIQEQNRELQLILSEYSLNESEAAVLEDYRSICLISQYPNVMSYLDLLNTHREKVLQFLRLILQR